MDDVSLQPFAGARRICCVKLIEVYHKENLKHQDKDNCTDSAHGTNPASARLAGYEIVNVKAIQTGVDLDELTK